MKKNIYIHIYIIYVCICIYNFHFAIQWVLAIIKQLYFNKILKFYKLRG